MSANAVQLYQECDDASNFFRNQFDHIQRHTRNFRGSLTTAEQASTLRKLQQYLTHTPSAEPSNPDGSSCTIDIVDRFLGGEILRAGDAARMQESQLLSELISTLSAAKICLIEGMTKDHLLSLVKQKNVQEIQLTCDLCEDETNNIQTELNEVAAEHKKSKYKSKAYLMEHLVENYYAANKQLNKFEQEIDKQTRLQVSIHLDDAWDDNLRRLSQLQDTASKQCTRMQGWKDKIGLLKSVIEKKKTDTSHPPDCGRSCTESIISSPAPRQLAKEADLAIGRLDEQTDHQRGPGNDVIMSDTTILNGSLVDAIPYPASQSATSLPTTTTDKLGPSVTAMTSQSVATKPVLTKASTACDIALDAIMRAIDETVSRSTPSISPQPLEQLDNLQSKAKARPGRTGAQRSSTDSDKENSLATESDQSSAELDKHEYEHNKPASPSVSPTSLDKDARVKAFVGLDRYAQGLFARSPTSSVGTPK